LIDESLEYFEGIWIRLNSNMIQTRLTPRALHCSGAHLSAPTLPYLNGHEPVRHARAAARPRPPASGPFRPAAAAQSRAGPLPNLCHMAPPIASP
jgi:hypothetical protein